MAQKNQTINDKDREEFAMNNESAYRFYKKARNKRKWIRENRITLDELIRAVNSRKPG